MANKQANLAVTFDEIINADRQKKKNQQLASELLGGKNRRASAPGPGAIQKSQDAKPGSLASRIGPRRSVSTSSRPRKGTQAPATVASARSQPTQNNKNKNKRDQPQNAERLFNAIKSHIAQPTARGPGLSIKGVAGPFFVIGSNFAPGTTAADIQASLEPVTGSMMSCRVLAHHPTVTVELKYADKWQAETAVANFHNQKADGRILSLVLTDPGYDENDYNSMRAQADRERMNRRGPPVHNGSHGFQNGGDLLQTNTSGLYSDRMTVDNPRNNNQRRRQKR
ncbi:hypothetical protein N7468_005979 [Penicillium chermesinum]|uniref:RRM domain-containing protein n=1 Tax=Penicillium chermesinum TaxID=63820 RepID=A0A9W9P2X0_9EURO|nr:uncharacterized protein N7468_005979 [Penicillium chermesinum]KAJ5233023.1 hypothetical protein N7468_005979 [Penicillium chermesinum]KAJ6172667.1 hypothetical protein N7470_001734 [Penicillium chermesinum]